jgi:intracellular septation protein A
MEQKKIMAWLKGEMEKVAKSWSVFFFFLSAAQEYVIQKRKLKWGKWKRWPSLEVFFFSLSPRLNSMLS